MKKIFLALFMVAFLFSGCKKCFNCTYTFPCSHCHYNNGSTGSAICDRSNNHQDYMEAQANCVASGAMWMAESPVDSAVEFCSTSKTDISSRETSCEQGYGVWSSK